MTKINEMKALTDLLEVIRRLKAKPRESVVVRRGKVCAVVSQLRAIGGEPPRHPQ